MNSDDSGGPWFIGEDQRLHLVGINSGAMSLSANEVIAGLSWRMDHPWTIRLLRKAAASGAEIHCLDELMRSAVPSSSR